MVSVAAGDDADFEGHIQWFVAQDIIWKPDQKVREAALLTAGSTLALTSIRAEKIDARAAVLLDWMFRFNIFLFLFLNDPKIK